MLRMHKVLTYLGSEALNGITCSCHVLIFFLLLTLLRSAKLFIINSLKLRALL